MCKARGRHIDFFSFTQKEIRKEIRKEVGYNFHKFGLVAENTCTSVMKF